MDLLTYIVYAYMSTPLYEGSLPEMNNVGLGQYKRIVQYFWDPEPKNNEEPGTPIWCLGEEHRDDGSPGKSVSQLEKPKERVDPAQYSTDPQRPTSSQQTDGRKPTQADRVTCGDPTDNGWPASFVDDFESKIWLTYRSGFPPIPKSKDPGAAQSMSLAVRLRSHLVDSEGFTTDTGWGCMIRSGQSLLANALSILRLGRSTVFFLFLFYALFKIHEFPANCELDWRRSSQGVGESPLLSLFADDPSAPFSIHRFVQYGATACGKYPGEWFGPSATARCIQYVSGSLCAW